MSNNTSIWKLIKEVLKPHGQIDLLTWVKENVFNTESAISPTYDFNATPYFKEPFLELLSNPNLKECNICSPVGSGKSQWLVALLTTITALFPKQCMIVNQSEQQVVDFLGLRVKPVMKKNPFIASIWPKRQDDRKESLHFPSHSIYTGSSTALNTLQSRSIDFLCLDEVWLFQHEGVVTEAKARLHDRPGSRVALVSQGGIIGDQFHKNYCQGLIKKYAWKCPACATRNIYKLADVKFEYEKDNNGTPIWRTVSAKMECPHCEAKYDDTPENRISFSLNAIYVVENHEQNYENNCVSYNFNALAMPHVSWTKLAIEFLKANHSTMRRTELRKFLQKRMGEFFDEADIAKEDFDLESIQGGYALGDFKLERWDIRILSVDVQKDRLFVVIRDWMKTGSSRLVDFRYLATFSDVEKLRIEYNVKSKEVIVDAAYRPEEVKKAGALYGWLGANGRGNQDFLVDVRGKGKIRRLYSQPVNYQIETNVGKKLFQVCNYSGVGIKDLLNTLRGDPRGIWKIASSGETLEQYLMQLQSEVRFIDPASGKPNYRKLRDENHAWDCECMQLVGALIHGCITYNIDNDPIDS